MNQMDFDALININDDDIASSNDNKMFDIFNQYVR